jgi:ribonuclease D
MTDTVPVLGDENSLTEPASHDKARWPLAFKLQPPKQSGQPTLQTFGFDSKRPPKKCWWSHTMYRGPENKPVQILYSKTKADSETIARQFLNESVIGFDMEWPWNDWKRPDLQNKIGLIQVAIEDKIALFHIGLHPGKTVDDIIAPSLRKLIEDPKIGKLGVGVLSADFARLRRFFHLKPRGAVELSHLYRLTKFGSWKPELVSTKLVSLARLVEDQLGYPLYKGDVRTSNWSKPLSKDQINYAAGDAYAGYMLYHCMNYKRLQMRPAPPLPILAEQYLEYGLSGIMPLRLDVKAKDGTIMTSETFFKVPMTDSIPSKSKIKDKKSPSAAKAKIPAIPKELTDPTSQALYNELVLRRSGLAEKAGVQVYRITTSPVLVQLALTRPVNKDQLLDIKGIGAKQCETYGQIWLDVISQFLNPNDIPLVPASTTPTAAAEPLVEIATAEPPSTPNHTSRRGRYHGEDSADSSPAFGTPVQRTPQLHTGLSFTMAETNLDAEGSDDATCSDSDDSLPSLDFGAVPDFATPQLKRKRIESPTRDSALTPSQRLQQLTKACETNPEAPITPSKPSALTAMQFEPLTPRSRITRNKLLAFSKLVTRKMAQRPANAPPIVTERTLSLIVVRAPQSMEELERIPGIDSLILACQQTGMDLLKNVVKFAGGPS